MNWLMGRELARLGQTLFALALAALSIWYSRAGAWETAWYLAMWALVVRWTQAAIDEHV